MKRYHPHNVDLRLKAVLLYRKGVFIKDVCNIYNISSASLMRWNKRFNGTKASLVDRSHVPIKKTYHIDLRLKAVLLYRTGKYTLNNIAKQYGFSIASLYKWNKKYNGKKDSLLD